MHERSARWRMRLLASGLSGLLGAWVAASGVSVAQSVPSSARQTAQYVDGIAAVVNHQVITLSRVQDEVRAVQTQLVQQNIPVPDPDTLRRQVLQRLIMQTLEAQEADRLNIRVSDAQVQQALASIAQHSQLSVAQLREELVRTGLTWEAYLQNLRQEIRTNQLRQQAVESLIHITEADVDAYLRSQGQRGAAQVLQPAAAHDAVLGLAQILIAVPEGAPPSHVQTLRQQAQDVLARLRAGEDFVGVAAAVSAAPEALSGGDLGVRPEDGWPELFLRATQGLQPGDVSDIVQSGNGFHILRVTLRQSAAQQASAPDAASELPQGPMLVTQTHARHILIKTSAVVSDAQARTRLEQLALRLEHGGEAFEDLARRYSQDASAPQGGDLGWLSPGETVPPFEQAMERLSDGQISEPVQSPFGWHLIQVLARRTRDMEDEYRRVQARQVLFQRRADPAYDDWLNRLREQAYIDNRLEPQSNRLRR